MDVDLSLQLTAATLAIELTQLVGATSARARQVKLGLEPTAELYMAIGGGTSYVAWAGYSFENLCLTHVPWIQRALPEPFDDETFGSWYLRLAAVQNTSREEFTRALFPQALYGS